MIEFARAIGYLGHETVMCMICEEQSRAYADNGADGGVSHAGAAIGLEELQPLHFFAWVASVPGLIPCINFADAPQFC